MLAVSLSFFAGVLVGFSLASLAIRWAVKRGLVTLNRAAFIETKENNIVHRAKTNNGH